TRTACAPCAASATASTATPTSRSATAPAPPRPTGSDRVAPPARWDSGTRSGHRQSPDEPWGAPSFVRGPPYREPMTDRPLQTTYRPRQPLDLRATVGGLQRGPGDPTQQAVRGVIWRAVRTGAGVATLALAQQSDGSVRAAAWGSGASRALAQVPALCGALDDAAGFDAGRHPLIADAHRR